MALVFFASHGRLPPVNHGSGTTGAELAFASGVLIDESSSMADNNTNTGKPPKTPPNSEPEEKVERSEELEREEQSPGESVDDVQSDEKGLPPGSKTSWN